MRKMILLCAVVGSLVCLGAPNTAEAGRRGGFGFSLNVGGPGYYGYGYGRPYYGGYRGLYGPRFGGGYYGRGYYGRGYGYGYRPVVVAPVYTPSYYGGYYGGYRNYGGYCY